MNAYHVLIPQLTLLAGILFLAVAEIWDVDFEGRQLWGIHILALGLAFAQQGILYRLESNLYARGGLIIDGATQAMSMSLLFLAILMQAARFREGVKTGARTHLLSLGVVLLSLFVIESNRYLFGIFSLVGVIWVSQGALASEAPSRERPHVVYSGIMSGVIFLVVGVLLSILCMSVFGESQMDEIQRSIVRGPLREFPLYSIEVLVLFMGSMVMGVPPFQIFVGNARKNASWSMSMGLTGVYALLGTSVLLRWGIQVFTRPGVESLDLESLTPWNILFFVRLLAVVGLISVPLLALLSSNLRRSLNIFLLTPFVQGLFAISFGQREVLGMGVAQIIVAVTIVGVILSSAESLGFPPDATIQNWVGLGRKHGLACLSMILGLSAAAGFAPFYGSVLVQKTLSINSSFGLLLLFNIVLSGFYVGRLLVLAFHGNSSGKELRELSKPQKIWLAAQFMLLIFMGIFWQHLYKYGAYSVRQFFGEI